MEQGIEANDPLTSETSKTQLMISCENGNKEVTSTCVNQGLAGCFLDVVASMQDVGFS